MRTINHTISAFLVMLGMMALGTFAPLKAHNVYNSISQVEWNASDNSIELVVQIHGHELETKLSILNDRRMSFLEDADFGDLEKATGDYLTSHINLALDETPVDLIFLGIETDGQTVIAYLEQDWPSAPSSVDYMNSIFLEDLAGQVNSVLVTVGENRQGGDIGINTGPLRFVF